MRFRTYPIYRNLASKSVAKNLQFEFTNKCRISKDIGDVCLAEISCVNAGVSVKFVLGAVYIHPRSTLANIGLLLHQSLLPYVVDDKDELYDIDPNMPIILCGDFNINVNSDQMLLKFMKRKFNLDSQSNNYGSTTLGGTVLDLTFVRHMTAELLPFVAYFSYHRPVMNRILEIKTN